jgi:hypothetical protein
LVALGPSDSFCLRSRAASHDGWSGPVEAAAGGAGAGRDVKAGLALALGVNVDGGLDPVFGAVVAVVVVAGVAEACPAGLPATVALLPYALAILPSVACSLAFWTCFAFLPYFLSHILDISTHQSNSNRSCQDQRLTIV